MVKISVYKMLSLFFRAVPVCVYMRTKQIMSVEGRRRRGFILGIFLFFLFSGLEVEFLGSRALGLSSFHILVELIFVICSEIQA